MEHFTEPITPTPPPVIMCGTDFVMCSPKGNAHTWLTPETMGSGNGFVIHDPDGSLLKRYFKDFRDNGYTVKFLDPSNPIFSAMYNPFAYISNTDDVEKTAVAIINGTISIGEPGDADFETCEVLLYTALISYIHNEIVAYDQNIGALITMLKYMELEEGELTPTPVDMLFEPEFDKLSRQQSNLVDAEGRFFREEGIGNKASQ